MATERTERARISIDFKFEYAKNAEELRTFANLVVGTVNHALSGIESTQWTKISPWESDFAWHDNERQADEQG